MQPEVVYFSGLCCLVTSCIDNHGLLPWLESWIVESWWRTTLFTTSGEWRCQGEADEFPHRHQLAFGSSSANNGALLWRHAALTTVARVTESGHSLRADYNAKMWSVICQFLFITVGTWSRHSVSLSSITELRISSQMSTNTNCSKWAELSLNSDVYGGVA